MGNSLALCMIVKNEEQYLPYCLASVYKICDEIIVVDTGSTDKTMEIAKGFGAYVIQAPWRDDFALVRNIAHSPAKSDWIIWLDADEVLSDAGARKIKNQLLLDNNSDFFLLPRVNFWKDLKHVAWYPDSQYKIYRNKIGLTWKNKIHEKIFDENDSYHRKRLKQTDVHTFHYAYVKSPEEVKKKMGLYIHIENPNMDMRQIDKCSTEHSFFYDKPHEGVQDYNGPLPEVFDRLEVSDKLIKWKDGPILCEMQEIQQPQVVQQPVKQVNVVQNSNDSSVKDLCSIIIATHNKIEYVEPLVKSIYQSTKVPFEIIIVDNGSTEENVLNYLRPMEKENSNFRFIHLEKNLGFAGGYNAGVKEAKGEWLCILNNDTLTTENWLMKMIEHLKDDPEIGIIAPVSNNIHGEHQLLAAPEGYGFGDYLTLMTKLDLSQGKRVVQSSWITGCVMVLHKNLLGELAAIKDPPRNGILFDESFEWGMSEDTDLDFYVTHRLGKKLAVSRDTFIFHHGQKSLEECPVDWRQIQEINNKKLRQKWPEIFPNG